MDEDIVFDRRRLFLLTISPPSDAKNEGKATMLECTTLISAIVVFTKENLMMGTTRIV